ncbi:MAG: helix-turn-helix transcriptional regulator [Bacteroidota bacterium]
MPGLPKPRPELTERQKHLEFFQQFFRHSEHGLWVAALESPLPITLPVTQQEEHIFRHAYLADCNTAFAAMAGYPTSLALIGVRFPFLIPRSNPQNLKTLQTFLSSGFTVRNAEIHTTTRNGQELLFLHDAFGIVEDNFLHRIWIRQRDVTRTAKAKQFLAELTPNQRTILQLTIQGKTLKEISLVVGSSEKTIDTIRARLRRKLHATTTPALVARAIQLGFPGDQPSLFE